ncbi:hypothetical protein M427DRAFT_35625 [Gonapodya prolifera JEL478]|uniref:L domain-like protein n=1 Tax=Gonapodya prolifera (strain JEL478) TaxID=1344416 RepID=A0A139A4B7_GONPJ|nr:hypothetical protein M427DRAFT_35625 [Gonapodya prolifera JEL478]|eukprot:KXS11667.1 hypothetical protein M427DRAFT_35625 [Gonapodya prolifera JEL478]
MKRLDPLCLTAIAILCFSTSLPRTFGQTHASDCAPFENIFDQSGKSLPNPGGRGLLVAAWIVRDDTQSGSGLSLLTNLSISNNAKSGPLPDLSSNTALSWVWLFSNALTGSIPDLSNFRSLVDLSLSKNQLYGNVDGKIPSTIQTCSLVEGPSNPDLFSSSSSLVPQITVSGTGSTIPAVSAPSGGSTTISATGGSTPAAAPPATGDTSAPSSSAPIAFIVGGVVAGAVLVGVTGVAMWYIGYRSGKSPSRAKEDPSHQWQPDRSQIQYQPLPVPKAEPVKQDVAAAVVLPIPIVENAVPSKQSHCLLNSTSTLYYGERLVVCQDVSSHV